MEPRWRIIFTSLDAGLSRVPDRGGLVTSVMKPDLKRQESTYFYPYFLPDGRHFLFGNFSAQKETLGIYLGSLDGGVSQRLLGDDSNVVLHRPVQAGGICSSGVKGN